MEIVDYIVATDSQLVAEAAKGDQQAFEYLFSRYKEAIMRLFEQRLGSKDTASDLLQETFIKVYLHLERYNASYTFGQWVYTIARNTLVDYLRRRADDVAIDERFRAPAASTPTPEESVIINQRRAHFDASLNELSEDYRQIIEMRFLEEYSYEEIAEKLDMKLGTVKTRIFRVRNMMCRLITQGEESNE